jgi:hypothetical protein
MFKAQVDSPTIGIGDIIFGRVASAASEVVNGFHRESLIFDKPDRAKRMMDKVVMVGFETVMGKGIT